MGMNKKDLIITIGCVICAILLILFIVFMVRSGLQESLSTNNSIESPLEEVGETIGDEVLEEDSSNLEDSPSNFENSTSPVVDDFSHLLPISESKGDLNFTNYSSELDPLLTAYFLMSNSSGCFVGIYNDIIYHSFKFSPTSYQSVYANDSYTSSMDSGNGWVCKTYHEGDTLSTDYPINMYDSGLDFLLDVGNLSLELISVENNVYTCNYKYRESFLSHKHLALQEPDFGILIFHLSPDGLIRKIVKSNIAYYYSSDDLTFNHLSSSIDNQELKEDFSIKPNSTLSYNIVNASDFSESSILLDAFTYNLSHSFLSETFVENLETSTSGRVNQCILNPQTNSSWLLVDNGLYSYYSEDGVLKGNLYKTDKTYTLTDLENYSNVLEIYYDTHHLSYNILEVRDCSLGKEFICNVINSDSGMFNMIFTIGGNGRILKVVQKSGFNVYTTSYCYFDQIEYESCKSSILSNCFSISNSDLSKLRDSSVKLRGIL